MLSKSSSIIYIINSWTLSFWYLFLHIDDTFILMFNLIVKYFIRIQWSMTNPTINVNLHFVYL